MISVDDGLKKIFPKAERFDLTKRVLTDEEVKIIEDVTQVQFDTSHQRDVLLYTARSGETVLGYVFEDTVIGKWGPIHYLLGVDPRGSIILVVILDYKEIRGRPIAKPRFLKQYVGKNVSHPLRLKKDIDGVTGATISSRSLTDGVRKLLHVFKLIAADNAP